MPLSAGLRERTFRLFVLLSAGDADRRSAFPYPPAQQRDAGAIASHSGRGRCSGVRLGSNREPLRGVSARRTRRMRRSARTRRRSPARSRSKANITGNEVVGVSKKSFWGTSYVQLLVLPTPGGVRRLARRANAVMSVGGPIVAARCPRTTFSPMCSAVRRGRTLPIAGEGKRRRSPPRRQDRHPQYVPGSVRTPSRNDRPEEFRQALGRRLRGRPYRSHPGDAAVPAGSSARIVRSAGSRQPCTDTSPGTARTSGGASVTTWTGMPVQVERISYSERSGRPSPESRTRFPDGA